jgi:uncharacterized membrane protein
LAIAAQSLLLVALALGAYLAYYHDAYHWPPIRGVALFGAEFVVVSATWIAARRVVSRPGFRADLLAAFVNAAAFFGLLAVATRMQPYGGFVLLCGCAIGMAAYHAYVGGSVLRRPEDDPLSRFVYLGLALTFVTIAIPLQLRASYVTLAWAVEGAVLVWTGVIAAERRVRWAGLALLAVTAAKALGWDISQPLDPFRLLLNTRMLSGASVVAALYVSAWLLWQGRDSLPEEERPAPVALVLVANLFTLIFVSLDLWDYVGQQRAEAAGASAQQLALSLFWSAYALAAMSAGIWRRARAVRLFALGLLITAVTKVFVFDLSSLDVPYRIVSFFVLGLILLAVALLYTRFESRLR